MFPHFQMGRLSHGSSPGNGITEMRLSVEPLASEGEATPGPDDYNPYEEADDREFAREFYRTESPTRGRDPFVFDDINPESAEFPGFDGRTPRFSFDFNL